MQGFPSLPHNVSEQKYLFRKEGKQIFKRKGIEKRINYNLNKIPSVNQILSQKGKQIMDTHSLNKACNKVIIYFITCDFKDTQIPISLGIFKFFTYNSDLQINHILFG